MTNASPLSPTPSQPAVVGTGETILALVVGGTLGLSVAVVFSLILQILNAMDLVPFDIDRALTVSIHLVLITFGAVLALMVRRLAMQTQVTDMLAFAVQSFLGLLVGLLLANVALFGLSMLSEVDAIGWLSREEAEFLIAAGSAAGMIIGPAAARPLLNVLATSSTSQMESAPTMKIMKSVIGIPDPQAHGIDDCAALAETFGTLSQIYRLRKSALECDAYGNPKQAADIRAKIAELEGALCRLHIIEHTTPRLVDL